MKSNIPWSVKGIDPEAREAAKIAARRAGMTLGEWLNSLILQSGDVPPGMAEFAAEVAAEEERDAAARRAQPLGFEGGRGREPAEENAVELQSKIETLNRRLDASERQNALAVSGIDQSIERLATTIESSRRVFQGTEMPGRTAIVEINDRLERLNHRIEEVAAHGRSGLDPRTLQALEKAIQGVASHIEKSDYRNTELVQSVEAALGELGAKVETIEDASSEAIGRVEVAVDRIGGRIDSTEAEQRRTSARLNERLAQIDDRIVSSLGQSDTRLQTIERRLQQMEARLELAQADLAKAGKFSPDATTRRDLEDLSRSLFVAQEQDRSQARKTFEGLDARVQAVSERMDRLFRDSEAGLEKATNLSEASRRSVEVMVDASEQRAARGLSELRALIEDLGQKTERTGHAATAAMTALEEVTRALTGRIDGLEARLAGQPKPEIALSTFRPATPEPPPVAVPPAPAEEPTPWWGRNREREKARDEEGTQGQAEIDEIDVEEIEIDVRDIRDSRDEEDTANQDDIVELGEPQALTASRDDDVRAGIDESPEDAASRPRAWFEREPEEASDDVVEVTEDVPPVETVYDREREDLIRAREAEEAAAAEADSGRPADGFPDLRSLRLNLREAPAAKDTGDDWSRPAAFGRAEPRLQEPSGTDEAPADDYLEQARRAALAAGSGERTGQISREREEGRGSRVWLWIVGALLLIAALGAVGWFVILPMINEPGTAGRTPVVSPPASQASGDVVPPAGDEASSKLSDLDALAESDGPGTEGAVTAPADGEAPATDEATDPAEASAPPAEVSPVEAMTKAAESGNVKAQYALALAYQSGRDVEKDVVKSAEWMRKAASGEGPVAHAAQYSLGVMLENGSGLAQDMREARVQYEKAARGGNAKAMHNLAVFFIEGRGGLKQDGALAERWFTDAAELGLPDSQFNLAILKQSGPKFGIAESLPDAYFWYAVASQSGDPLATQQRDTIIDRLTPEERRAVDERLRTWRPKPMNLPANAGFDTSAETFLPAEAQRPLGQAELMRIQQSLNELGYDAGTADGQLGEKSIEAIKAFQKAYSLDVTGVADRNLLQALASAPR